MSLTERVARALADAARSDARHAMADAAIREVLAEVRRAAVLHVKNETARAMMGSVHGLMLARFEQGKPLAPEGGK